MKTPLLQLRDAAGARRGFSMVEMLVVITLSTMVVGTAISLMIGLRQWDRRFSGRAVECDRLVELAETLRADIRQAADVTAPAEGQLLVLQTDGTETRYELEPLGCTRKVESANAADRRTELFAIGAATAWDIERGTADRRPLVRVTLERNDANSQAPRRAPLLVYGALGADVIVTGSSE